MNALFQNLLTASLSGSIVILAVLILRLVLRKTPKKFICILWMLAGLRLLLPIPLQSKFSLQPPAISIPWLENAGKFLIPLWIVIALAILAASVLSYMHLRRQVRSARKVRGGWESDNIETAFVLGFLKPKIYIPAGVSEDTRRQILAHERTHLDKGDHWIKLIGFLALALHWFNPLVWVSYILLCKDMEMACDERVVQFMDLPERKAYSAALLDCSTNRVHYAACPVAFGEVSVKYRIKSVLNYRKPGFWICLLGVLAICFVAVCLGTNPVEKTEDPEKALAQSSRQEPESFVPATQPPMEEENPDEGVTVTIDAVSPGSAVLVYTVENRYSENSETMRASDFVLQRWNGTAWEDVPGFRDSSVEYGGINVAGYGSFQMAEAEYMTSNVNWRLSCGDLGAGDYRMVQTITGDQSQGRYYTSFHIYREQLPSEEEKALEKCQSALERLTQAQNYVVTLWETAPNGVLMQTRRIVRCSSDYRVDNYRGGYHISGGTGENAGYAASGWEKPFSLDENRKFLFPEGQSTISENEVFFRSVWTDYDGNTCQGTDTYEFLDNGSLSSVNRLQETTLPDGTVERRENRVVVESLSFGDAVTIMQESESYTVKDSYEAKEESLWKIFFRVDDDLLKPTGGEVWLATGMAGVSQCTTDEYYWLEKKTASGWERLGDNQDAAFPQKVETLTSNTQMFQVDWSETYGALEPGLYRMGKHFYYGQESTIQYAEFAIYEVGGYYGVGAEEAVKRVDAALEKLQAGNYHVRLFNTEYSPEYSDRKTMALSQEIWKYGDTQCDDYYWAGKIHHHLTSKPGDFSWGDWLKRNYEDSPYDRYYFPEGYGTISDGEITFLEIINASMPDYAGTFYSYRFDEQGNLTDILVDYFATGTYNYHYIIEPITDAQGQAHLQEAEAFMANYIPPF